MKLLKSTLLTFVAAFALSSCSSDDPEQTVQYGYDNNITYVTDLSTNTSVMTGNAYYVMDFDLVSGKANIDITNLRLTPGKDAPTLHLRIEKATFGQDKETGAVVITVPNAVSMVDGTTHNISNFKLTQNMAYLNAIGQIAVYYSVSFELDNQYSIIAVQRSAYLPGVTNITNNADGSVINSSNRPYYVYILDHEKSTATLSVYYFDDKNTIYPELTFEKLPFTLTNRGIEINVEEKVTAKQLAPTATPFVANAINVDSRYDASTIVRILTDQYLSTASLTYRPQSDKN